MNPTTSTAHKAIQEIPDDFKALYRGDFPPPDPADIFPRQYSNERQRLKLYRYGLRHFKRVRNWNAARAGELPRQAVANWIRARVREWRLTLPAKQIEAQIEAVHMTIVRNMADGSTRAGLTRFCAAAGRKSGAVRRARNTERDAAILRRIAAGESKAALARELGLTRQAIQHVCNRQGGDASEPNIQGASEPIIYTVGKQGDSVENQEGARKVLPLKRSGNSRIRPVETVETVDNSQGGTYGIL